MDEEETQRLQKLVETLSQETESLKREIILLASAPDQ